MRTIEEPKRRAIIKDFVDKYPEEIQTALAKPETERTPFECQMAAKARLYLDPNSHQYIAGTETVAGSLKDDTKKRWDELHARLETFQHLHPGKLPVAAGMADLGGDAPATYLLNRGLYDAPKDEVPPGFLSLLDPRPTVVRPLPGVRSTGRRAALAKLLTDPGNPLTARVMVNRIWQYHFGQGLVRTASDFGRKGEPPTHPRLLDWLADEFIRNHWSVKHIHRLIVASNTYRQSSRFDSQAARLDPDNKLLWRFPRQRLEGETIRDAALAVAGILNPKMGGPSIFPELPEGLSVTGGWKVSKEESERNRRSIYVFVRRNTRYPLFESFDMPDTHETCSRRTVTTSPIQALTLLNSKLTLEWAQALAGRILRSAGADLERQIETAYQVALSRGPDRAEKQMARVFFDRQRGLLAERLATGEPLALPAGMPVESDRAQAASLVDFCHTLMNANEFVYRN